MLAKVPRIITSWLPRREPYELKSRARRRAPRGSAPAGESSLIEPAGEMWSVVTLSPSFASTLAPSMSVSGARLGAHPLEVRRQAHVGRVVLPREAVAGRAPRGRSSARRRRRPRRSWRGTCPSAPPARPPRRPPASFGQMSREEDISPSCVLAERLVEQVHVHRPGERVGDDERRRREVVHLHVGVDAALEVAVAAEHRDDREIVLADRRRRSPPAAGPELPMQVVQP